MTILFQDLFDLFQNCYNKFYFILNHIKRCQNYAIPIFSEICLLQSHNPILFRLLFIYVICIISSVILIPSRELSICFLAIKRGTTEPNVVKSFMSNSQ